MKKIVKFWFDGDQIVGVDETGTTFKQSLLWYPELLKADIVERNKYEFGLDGIHWRNLDTDISFESFFYDDAQPSV